MTFQHTVRTVDLETPTLVETVRDRLYDEAARETEAAGLQITTAEWDNQLTGTGVAFRLVVACIERTDGEWPAIWAAYRQDVHDREMVAPRGPERPADPRGDSTTGDRSAPPRGGSAPHNPVF